MLRAEDFNGYDEIIGNGLFQKCKDLLDEMIQMLDCARTKFYTLDVDVDIHMTPRGSGNLRRASTQHHQRHAKRSIASFKDVRHGC